MKANGRIDKPDHEISPFPEIFTPMIIPASSPVKDCRPDPADLESLQRIDIAISIVYNCYL
jgi:hypothetical protein